MGGSGHMMGIEETKEASGRYRRSPEEIVQDAKNRRATQLSKGSDEAFFTIGS